MRHFMRYLRDERGVETLEWAAIGALIIGVAFAVYPGTLRTGLNTVITNIVTALTGIVIPAPPVP